MFGTYHVYRVAKVQESWGTRTEAIEVHSCSGEREARKVAKAAIRNLPKGDSVLIERHHADKRYFILSWAA